MINFDDYKFLDSVPGFLRWGEGCALLEWAATWPVPGIIVELGSFKGRSTVFLGSGACISHKIVYAVDHFLGSEEHRDLSGMSRELSLMCGSLLPQFKQNVYRCGLDDQVRVLVGDHAASSNMVPGDISILFIDGEHDYESTKANFEAWRHVLADGALVLFHDDDNTHPGVKKAISELHYERLPNAGTIAAFVYRLPKSITVAEAAGSPDSADAA